MKKKIGFKLLSSKFDSVLGFAVISFQGQRVISVLKGTQSAGAHAH